MVRATYGAFDTSLQLLQNHTRLMWAVDLELLPLQIYALGAANNAVVLANRKSSLVVWLLSLSWPHQGHDE